MPVITSDGMYEIGGRKYIDIDNMRFKVPWRYNRIIGISLKCVHDLKKGDAIKNFSFESKKWNGETFYVLTEIA
jgi:hypothetical protein